MANRNERAKLRAQWVSNISATLFVGLGFGPLLSLLGGIRLELVDGSFGALLLVSFFVTIASLVVQHLAELMLP